MAQLDPVADLNSCGGLVGLSTLQVPMAFRHGRLECGEVLIEATGGDQTDQQLGLLRIHLRRTGGIGAGIGVGALIRAVTRIWDQSQRRPQLPCHGSRRSRVGGFAFALTHYLRVPDARRV